MKLYDTVRLKEDNPAVGVTTDNLGSIVDVLGDNEAYTVEFFDSDGNTIEDALFIEFTDDQLEFVSH
jgi:hypothetical protein